RHTAEFLPQLLISQQVFSRTYENIKVFGMNLEDAIFDESYGSLRFVPSEIIRTGMRLIIDSVKISVQIASRTLISFSLQLSNTEKVERMLKMLLVDIVTTMKTLTNYITPIILGVITVFQKVIILSIGSIAMQQPKMPVTAEPINLPTQFASLERVNTAFAMGKLHKTVLPWQFILIVVTYMIELIVILTYLNTMLTEESKYLYKVELAKTLPISILIFTFTVAFANLIMGAFFH
ncbi:MAG: hypothetical protein J7L14_00125, partial [Candidatus Diapherotrites archaeon]|nr:hypothetical protein [Candidatus Diapherotrites archaeon]